MTTGETARRTAAAAAVRGTVATLLGRLLSFAATHVTLRRLPVHVLGVVHIRLELLRSAILFVSRQGLRLALTRWVTAANWNVAWTSLPLVTLLAAVAAVWHVSTCHGDSNSNDNNDNEALWCSDDLLYGGLLYCLAAAVEGWGEPAVLHALRQLDTATPAAAESAGTLVQTVATLVLLLLLPQSQSQVVQSPICALGTAHVLSALTYTCFLYVQVGRDLVGPRWHSLHGPTVSWTVVCTLQGLFKHVLTEGDRLVLATVASAHDQGVYALGSAYGGLAARLLLAPLEENARLLWSRLADDGDGDDHTGESPDTTVPSSTKRTTRNTTSANQTSRQALEDSYTVLVKVVLYIGLVFSCLAVHYTGLLLQILAGHQWGAEAANVLSAFCVYTAFLAMNGMTEAFCYAVAAQGTDMGRMALVHTLVGLVFAATAIRAVPRYGSVGLVAANCLAMALRTIYSVGYAVSYFNVSTTQEGAARPSVRPVLQRLVGRMLPHPVVGLAFGSAFYATRLSLARFTLQAAEISHGSRLWYQYAAQHVAIGATCGVGILTLAYTVEAPFRHRAASLLKQKTA
jgi:oligosaccharide translocation protein RFT1